MSVHSIFTYGTLKSGELNHRRLKRQGFRLGHSCGTGQTVKRFPLVLATRFQFPFLLDAEGQGHRVKGEVFRVDDETLKVYDMLESSPSLYTRISIEVEMTGENHCGDEADCSSSAVENKANCTDNHSSIKTRSGDILHCFTYVLKDFKEDLLQLPLLPEYQCPFTNADDYVAFLKDQNFSRQENLRESFLLKGIDVDDMPELPFHFPLSAK